MGTDPVPMKYAQWIRDNVPASPPAVRGTCIGTVARMIVAFPELRATSGTCGGEPHWWCVDTAGKIVDPTRHQFASAAKYRERPQHRYQDTITGVRRRVA